MALWLARAVPAVARSPSPRRRRCRWEQRLRQTLSAPGPWLVAMTFAVYAGQWLAVIGFLPTIYLEAGVSGAATGVLTALAAAVNMLGNLASGRLLHAGVRPTRLLNIGFVAMGLAAVAAFAAIDGVALPAPLRYAAVLLFSMVGGLIPGDAVLAGACAWRPASRRCPPPSAGCSNGRHWASLPARRWWPGWPAAAAAGNGPGWPPARAPCSACC